MVWGSTFPIGFPEAVWYCINKEASVEASLSRKWAEDRRIWDVRFIREFNDWEMDEGLHFLCIGLVCSDCPVLV